MLLLIISNNSTMLVNCDHVDLKTPVLNSIIANSGYIFGMDCRRMLVFKSSFYNYSCIERSGLPLKCTFILSIGVLATQGELN